MAGGLFLLDTNVLIRWVQHEASEYSLIKNSIQHLVNAGGAPCYTAQNLSEFWNVLTRPVKNNGYELSIEQADARAKYIETSLQLLLDNHDVYRVWRDLLVAHSILGFRYTMHGLWQRCRFTESEKFSPSTHAILRAIRSLKRCIQPRFNNAHDYGTACFD
jgi:predicted nucleic acid-binding protein